MTRLRRQMLEELEREHEIVGSHVRTSSSPVSDGAYSTRRRINR